MSSMVFKPKLLLDCSLSMGIKSWRRERCQDNSAWGFSGSDLLLLPSGKGPRFLMIHTIALLSAVYLDLEFISSPAKLCKALANNRFHVGKAHFQYGICLNALLCNTSFVSMPLLMFNRYSKGTHTLRTEEKHKNEGPFKNVHHKSLVFYSNMTLGPTLHPAGTYSIAGTRWYLAEMNLLTNHHYL